MKQTTILFWQALLVLGFVVGGLMAGTQYVAHTLGYPSRLGAAWFFAGEFPVYQPWKLFEWWFFYGAYAPDVFDRGGLIAGAGGIAALVAAILGSSFRGRQRRNVTTYGSSRWATRRDIKRAGLFSPKGVMLGQRGGAYLRHDGAEHVMAFAPTRSGKGVGLVVPTLLSWTASAIIHDIKGENWELTSGWRAGFSHCLKFDPTDASSARYNPLLDVRLGEGEVRDVQNIADILVDPDGSLDRRDHWDKTAHTLLVGAILHVLYAGPVKTLTRVAELLSDPARSSTDTLEGMLRTNHLGTEDAPQVHPVIAQSAQEVLNKTENERSGVISTALSYLSLYRDPVIAAVTAACDWRIEDLVAADKPVSLYLIVPPSDISRTKPLIRLILNQIGRRLTEHLSTSDAPRRKVLFMLDEFPALGRLDFFESALAFMAGYGLRAFLIAQSLNQIEKAYGPNNSVLDNCHVRVALAANDERTAKRLSDALGTKTEQRAMNNYTGHRLSPWLSHKMVSRQETARQLLTPGEVMQLPADQELILLAGTPPIRASKLRYYEDRNFTARVSAPPSGPTFPPRRFCHWEGRTAFYHAALLSKPPRGGAGGESGGPVLGPVPGPGTGPMPQGQGGAGAVAEVGAAPRELADQVRRADALDHTTDIDLFRGGRS